MMVTMERKIHFPDFAIAKQSQVSLANDFHFHFKTVFSALTLLEGNPL